MTWTKLPDNWNDMTQDVWQLSPHAEVLHVRILVHCNRLLSDGFIRDTTVRRFTTDLEDPNALITELIAAGLWAKVDSGYQLDWSEQEESGTVRKRLEQNRQRQQKFRERRDEMKRKRWEKRDAELDEQVARNGFTTALPTLPPFQSAPNRAEPTRTVPPKGDRDGEVRGAGTGAEGSVLAADRIAPGGAPVLARPSTWRALGPMKLEVYGNGLSVRCDYDDDWVMANLTTQEAAQPYLDSVVGLLNEWARRMEEHGYRVDDAESSYFGLAQCRWLHFEPGADEACIERIGRSVLSELTGNPQ